MRPLASKVTHVVYRTYVRTYVLYEQKYVLDPVQTCRRRKHRKCTWNGRNKANQVYRNDWRIRSEGVQVLVPVVPLFTYPFQYEKKHHRSKVFVLNLLEYIALLNCSLSFPLRWGASVANHVNDISNVSGGSFTPKRNATLALVHGVIFSNLSHQGMSILHTLLVPLKHLPLLKLSLP